MTPTHAGCDVAVVSHPADASRTEHRRVDGDATRGEGGLFYRSELAGVGFAARHQPLDGRRIEARGCGRRLVALGGGEGDVEADLALEQREGPRFERRRARVLVGQLDEIADHGQSTTAARASSLGDPTLFCSHATVDRVTYGRMLRLGALAWLTACAQPPSHGASGSATTAPAASAPVGPPRSGAGAALAGEQVLLVDGRAAGLLVAKVSSDEEPTTHALPGRAGQLAVTGERVLVTVGEPSLLMSLEAGSLTEKARVPLPPGAHGIAVSARGEVLVVSTRAAELSLVDVAAKQVRWSVPLAKAPREVRLSRDGTRAFVTHRVGSGVTVVSRTGDSWSAEPRVVAALAGKPRVEGASVSLADGRVLVFHGLVEGERVTPELGLLSDGAPLRSKSPALPAGSFVRALVARASGTVLVATDDALIELASKPGSDAVARSTHTCADARGIALDARETAAYLSCGDGRVAVVALPLENAVPIAYLREVPVDKPDCEAAEGAGDAPISDSFAQEFLRADQMAQVLRRYHCRYPARTHLFPIATTHGQRKVWALAIGREPRAHDRPTLFINGGHHGDELMAALFALDAVQALLEDNVAEGALEDVVFVVAPLVNPDGNHHRLVEHLLGRKNGRDNDADGTRDHEDGVDLNRNYPFRWGALGEEGSRSKTTHKWFRGPSAGSEPETQGVMRLAASEKFVASMSFHTGTLAMCAPYTIPDVKSPEPDAGWMVGQEIVAHMPPHPEGSIPVKRRLYPLDGNDQDWHRHEHGTLAFLWEGGTHWLAHPRGELMAPARAAWLLLAKRFVNGPAFSLRAHDAAGQPLVAEVSVKEIAHYEGERFTTRCRDGRFDYILPKAGDYTVVVSVGDTHVERKITVQKGQRPELDVLVPVLVDEPATCPTPSRDAGPAATWIGLR